MIGDSIVVDIHDRKFIEEVISLYRNGFYRAAYLMAWLCCVESFRTKFKILAESGDDKAIWERIQSIENNHKSADLDIIRGAFEANFIDEIEKQKLEYFYKMRCVYGHPYEQAPNAVDCEHIIQSVIDISLSKKLLLGKTSIDSIFSKIREQESFLDNDEEKTKEYFANLIKRIDPKQYQYLWDILIIHYDTIEKETENNFSFFRTRLFIDVLIERIGIRQILVTIEQQENFIYKYKKTALIILSRPYIYEHLNEHIKSIIFNELKAIMDSLKIALLMNENLLENNQANEIQELLNAEKLDLRYFDAKFIVSKLITKLESHDFNKQNSAIYVLRAPHVKGTLKYCEVEDLTVLGRNILQSANHESSTAYYSESAYGLLSDAETLQSEYPSNMIKGIVAECFTNDRAKTIRAKIGQINLVESILKNYSENKRKKILEYTESLIDSYTLADNQKWDSIKQESLFYSIVQKIQRKPSVSQNNSSN